MSSIKSLFQNHLTIVFIAFALLMGSLLIFSISLARTSGDFDVYYQAGKQFLAKAPIYVSHGGINEFKYLPLFAFLFSPLSNLPQLSALYCWDLLNIALFFLTFQLLNRLQMISFKSIKDFIMLVLLFALVGRYVFDNIKIGQANILLLYLMVLTLYLQTERKYYWAGTVLAFSLMIKFFPLLLLAYFLITREFKTIGFTVLMTIIFLLLPSVYTGFSLNLMYIHQWYHLLQLNPPAVIYSARNNSLLSFFSWVFIARHKIYGVMDYNCIIDKLTPAVYFAWICSLMVFFSFFYGDILLVKRRNSAVKIFDYGCLFICGLLFNPLSYFNALVFLTVPFCCILRYLFYTESKSKDYFFVVLLTVMGFVLFIAEDRVFCKVNWVYYGILETKPLMWTVIMAYLSLWWIKFRLMRVSQ